MFANNYISAIVDAQLPDFVRADHPNFVLLLKKYYEYMEQSGKTLYENKRLYDYFDVDKTRSDLVTYFKSKIIPNFPEESELSTEKLIKSARDFYTKKGTPDSFKFLFRVLYGQEIDVYFPKEDILRASDGKWKLPQALRLAISDTLSLIPGGSVNVFVSTANTVNANGINLASTTLAANSMIRVGSEKRKVVSINSAGDFLTVNIPFANTSNNANTTQIYDTQNLFRVVPNEYENFDFNLIERRQGVGSLSRATCIIESAVKSVDKETGREIVEVYISNLRKPLIVGESLEVEYEENEITYLFSSKIISLISNVNLARNRAGVLQSGKRYSIGDPVVFFGGLNDESPDAVKAVATVANVTIGSLNFVRITSNTGYYFRDHPNSVIQIQSTSGSGANAIVTAIWRDGENLVANAVSNTVTFYEVTNSGTSDYVINGNNDPTLYFYRGLTYTLNVNASGHPFWIQTVPGAYDASNVYTEGVINGGAAVGEITFNVPMNAPDTLYYVCQNHAVMGGEITMLTLPSSGTSNTDTFKFNTDAIRYKKDILFNDEDGYDFDNVSNRINLTIGAGNTTTTVNLNTASYVASTVDNYYKSFVLKIVEGTGAGATPNSAVISQYYGANQIAVLDSALGIAPDGTSKLRIYANAQTEIGRAMTFDSFIMGRIRDIDLIRSGGGFSEEPTFEVESLFETDYSEISGFLRVPAGQFAFYNPANLSIQLNQSNTSYSTANGFYTGARLFLDTGINQHYAVVTDYVVNNVSLPNMTKILYFDRAFEPNITTNNILNYRLFLDFRGSVKDSGRIGVIEILNGGSGYHATDTLDIVGTGYGAKAAITVLGGKIVDLALIDRGEGYYGNPTIVVKNTSGGLSNGTGATFRVTGLSDGETLATEVTALGAIQSFNIINRGYDYVATPEVSIKVADIYSDNIYSDPGIVATISSGTSLWQGANNNAEATFTATIDEIYKLTGSNSAIIRVFNYSGTMNVGQPVYINTSSQNVTVNIVSQNATISFKGINPAVERPYPYFYGDGLAKANAEFLNGLIKYNGFYLNTDGHLSSDKRIQDGEYYHNFSYEIQSEKSLNDYKETIDRVAHPAGMQLWSKYLLRNEIDESVATSSNVHYSNTAQHTTCNAAFNSTIVYGNNSDFANTANVGDLIVINSGNSTVFYEFTKIITDVNAVNDTLIIESPIERLGDGFIRLQANNKNAVVFGNVYPVHYSIRNGATLYMPGIATVKTLDPSTGVSNTSNVIVFNNSNNLINANVQYRVNHNFISVPYKIIKANTPNG